MKKLILILLVAFGGSKGFAQTTIAAKDAAKHIGETVTVCEKVFGGKYLDEAGITFLNLGGDHPNELLALVIKGDDRKKFSAKPEEMFKDKNVCVTGPIVDYKGKPEMMITDPSQIKISDK